MLANQKVDESPLDNFDLFLAAFLNFRGLVAAKVFQPLNFWFGLGFETKEVK